MQTETITIPARSGKAARVNRGQSVTAINPHGSQVVDTRAFSAENKVEATRWLSEPEAGSPKRMPTESGPWRSFA